MAWHSVICMRRTLHGGRTDVRRHQESARHAKIIIILYEGWDDSMSAHGQYEVDIVIKLA